MTRRWLVTGGAGFVGSHLAERLLARGDAVTVLDDLSTGMPANLPRHPRLDLRTGDVNDADALGAALRGAAGVFHCAATVYVQDCIADWLGAHAVNLGGTIRVFEAARRAGGLPVVYASSAAVYGDPAGALCHEDLPERPISPYGADKLACEHQARAFWQVHALPTAGLRFFNVFGPRQSARSAYAGVLAAFGRDLRLGRASTIHGDGGQTRDFVHVSDVARALVAAMGRLGAAPGCLVANVCTGRSVSVRDLHALVRRHGGGLGPPPAFAPARPGEIRLSRGCTARMHAVLGRWRTMPLEEGIAGYLASLGGAGGVLKAAE